MAQEPGLFSVRRPRETLGGINHNASSIPMPSSAMKRSSSISNLQTQYHHPPSSFGTGGGAHHGRSVSTSSSRMSLAPTRPSQPTIFQRSSSGTNLAEAGFQSVHRNSTANIFNSTGPTRKSYAPTGVGGATPAPPTFQLGTEHDLMRRSSMHSAARPSGAGAGAMMGGHHHQSFFATAPVAATAPTDPRRLKDASVRSHMAQELMEYLTRGNFEMAMKHSLTNKSMTSPTQKDFNCMFQWLYHKIDPPYRFQKSIDAEVPPLLKAMRYPFEKNIMKSQIAAVGGNNWPTFLGLLHWMMQLAQMMERFGAGAYDDACAEAGYDISNDRIIFQFLSGAYGDWISVEEEEEDDADKLIKPHIDAMAAKFDATNAQHLEQLAMLEAEHKALQDQIDELGKAGPRLAKLDEQIKILEEDRVKFENYNNKMEAKVDKNQNRVRVLEEEIKKIEAELEEVEQEKSGLQQTVDKQGITIQDIDRMNADRELLQKGLEAANIRLEESRKRVAEKEHEAASKLDELERLVERYNSLGYQISIIPSSAANAKGHEYELVLSIDESPKFGSSQLGGSQLGQTDRLLADAGTGYQPHHVLNLDLKGAVRSNILSLRKEIGDRRNAALEADMNNHDLLDKIKEAIDDKEAEVEGLGHKLRAAEEEFEKTREISTAQKMASDAQIEKMEKELAKMRAGLTESVQLMEQREINTNIEYEQLTLRADDLREELHTEIERMLNDIIRFKVHVQKSLEDYEQFVAEEVERECAEQEQHALGEDEEVLEDMADM